MNDKKSSKYNSLCEESIEKLIKNIAIILLLIIVSHIMFGIGPFYVFLVRNEHVTPVGIRLPFVDIDTNTGYVLNLSQQALMTFFELISTISVEIGQSLINNAITTVPKIIHLELDELSNKLTDGKMFSVKLQLRNVLRQIEDFDR